MTELQSCMIGFEKENGSIQIVRGFIEPYSRGLISQILKTHYRKKPEILELILLGDFKELGQSPIINPFYKKFGPNFFNESEKMSDEEYSRMIFSQDEYTIPVSDSENAAYKTYNSKPIFESYERFFKMMDIFLYSEKENCWTIRRYGENSNYLVLK